MPLPQRLRMLSRVCFFLLWVPFVTLFIGMASLPSGSYDWVELPLLARYSIIGVGFFGVATAILLVASIVAGGAVNRATLARGRPAMATILQIIDTGTTINENPLVRFVLEVQPPDGPSFQAQSERVIPRLQIPQVQPGAVVHVKYDPETKAVAFVPADSDSSLPPA